MAVIQLQTLSGIAKGLTRTADLSLSLDESPEEQADFERLQNARSDARMVKLRAAIFSAAKTIVELWSVDAGISDVRLFLSLSNSSFIFFLR